MIFRKSIKLLLSLFAVGAVSATALAADYEETYSGGWRNSDDVVFGWDWTLPGTARPAKGSGIFNLNTKVPPDFPGNHIKQVNAKWRELEPSEGNYDFSSILRELDDAKPGGVMLNVRGMVVAIKDGNGNPAFQAGVTAPKWLSATAPKTQEGLRAGANVTNMHIYDPRVKARYIKLIQAIGDSRIPGHPKLIAQIIHGVSSSRGEEWTGTQASRPEAIAAMKDIILAWGAAYGPNARKLAWLKEDPTALFNASVVESGTGIRGGAVEKWLRFNYTPGKVGETGQELDQNGYLSVDENFPPIAQGRHFQDQNESYRSSSSLPKNKWPQNYRMANLRMLQMRRNIAWTEDNSTINPKMLNWMSLGLGQTAKTSPDAWVLLMRTWARAGGKNIEINNFERWLHQRDINGVSTSPELKVEHGKNVNADSLPSNLWKMDVARTAPRIGIAVGDRFLQGGPHNVAVKVAYFDSSNGDWSLKYTSNDGKQVSKTVAGRASGRVKTATLFLNDFNAKANGYQFDFTLESAQGNTPFMFVRLIKLEEGGTQTSAAPNAPADFQIVQ